MDVGQYSVPIYNPGGNLITLEDANDDSPAYLIHKYAAYYAPP
jgi:hypothetical protein